jgi:murein DD-endopeptidase MepM/ murein hydrolase activator NlpD
MSLKLVEPEVARTLTALLDCHGSHRRPLGRLVRILLAVMVLAPLLVVRLPATSVRADGLSEAQAEQARLTRLIADQNKQLAGLRAKQKNLHTQMQAASDSLTTINASLDDLDAQLVKLRGSLSDAQVTYESLVGQFDLLAAELVQIEAQEAARQAELEQLQRILADRLVAAYEADRTSLLQQLLTAHSLTDALSDVSYYMDLSAADAVLADEIEADQRVLAQLHQNAALTRDATLMLAQQIAAQKTELDAQMTQLGAAQTQLQDLRRQTAAQLAAQKEADARLARDKAGLDAAIKSNGEAQAALARKIDELIADGGGGRVPSSYNGTLRWPMGGVVTQEFGCTGFYAEPRLGSCAHYHIGIDLAAPCGTQIRAAAAGTVVFVGYNPFDAPPRAWIVIIAHSTTLNTWYAHMKAKAPAGIRAGANVEAGQLVGWEASTGHSTGCHLHWAVRQNRSFMNPRLFV